METTKQAKRITFLKVPVDILPSDSLEEVIMSHVNTGEHKQIVFIKFKDFMRARRDKEYRRILEEAGLVIPHSLSLARGLAFAQKQKLVRHQSFDFIIKLIGILEKYRKSLYILGGNRKVTQVADSHLRTSFPGISLVGRYSGYYPKDMEENILTAIHKSGPTLLLVGDGVRQGDKWIFRNRKKLNSGLSIWDKSVFQIIAGKKRKPNKEQFEKGGLSAIQFLRNPLRIFRIFQYTWFGILLLIERIKYKKSDANKQ